MIRSTRVRAQSLLPFALAMALSITPFTAQAADTVTIFDGDGGLVQQPCNAAGEQIRIDSSSFTTMSVCFGLTRPTGWIATHITGSYGVVNNLKVPAHIAFKLPDGAVYWQETVDPGKVATIDVARTGSTVVEIQVTPVSTNTGPATGTLTASTDAAPNYVSFRSANQVTSGTVMRVTWNGIGATTLDKNSAFTDRLDGTFKVVKGLDGSACVSLESASYPGAYLTAVSNTTLALSNTPAAARATFCPVATSPTSAQQLRLAADQTKALALSGSAVTLASTSSPTAAWFVDSGLARP
ncbi:AbfB domain-containing protein [Corynebacterium epidermidicanis]|uniref:Alpha-L-arabinofuranosidase B (ABFB) n=1 Tax=Corynebacterium epidermidicanis TaxID=1050174 RepID=A0A0G3GWQ2_9CORY|nr:AbfB domain-containing protein [Corynebacterium epidermidicanis]AKK03958.1 Alpha-L-arabinofuranosidase B (ABFB) [Corynebacterium epidermidicanis]